MLNEYREEAAMSNNLNKPGKRVFSCVYANTLKMYFVIDKKYHRVVFKHPSREVAMNVCGSYNKNYDLLTFKSTEGG